MCLTLMYMILIDEIVFVFFYFYFKSFIFLISNFIESLNIKDCQPQKFAYQSCKDWNICDFI